MPSVRVIIVNFNAGEALSACVDAVLTYAGELAVVVSDNASADESMSELEARFGEESRLETCYNNENLGFGRAVNEAARTANEDYVLILNPDCILAAATLQALIEALENDPEAALASPWVTDSDGKVQSGTWRRLPDPWLSFKSLSGLHRLGVRMPSMGGVNEPGQAPPNDIVVAEAVSGACMLWRNSAVEQVGYLDEAYAMHGEDLDLMYRLRDAGHHCLLVPEAKAVHSGGVSSASRPWWVHRQKHFGMQRYFSKFLARDHALVSRWFIYMGIWAHFVLTLPMVLYRRIKRAA